MIYIFRYITGIALIIFPWYISSVTPLLAHVWLGDLVGIWTIIGNAIILDGFRFIVFTTGQFVPFIVQ